MKTWKATIENVNMKLASVKEVYVEANTQRKAEKKVEEFMENLGVRSFDIASIKEVDSNGEYKNS